MLQSCVEELKVVSEMKRDQEELQPLKSALATADEERGCRRMNVPFFTHPNGANTPVFVETIEKS